MEKHVMISQARRDLFDLFEEVVSKGRTRVLIRHRDSDEQAVLISRKELGRMEARARASETAAAFSLAESATIHGAPEDVLTGVRRRQAELEAAKAHSLSSKRAR
jgi:PHD/YefM family antitoxin component YafN of YafNO toxin-antitoxin module